MDIDLTQKRKALVLDIKKENSTFKKALLQVDGCEEMLWIEVIFTVNVGDVVFVSEKSVQEAILNVDIEV